MAKKKYTIHWVDDEKALYEVNGISYQTLDAVPNAEDRRKLAAMEIALAEQSELEAASPSLPAPKGDFSAERVILWVFSGVSALMLLITFMAVFSNMQKINHEQSADGQVMDVIKQRRYINQEDRVYEDYYYPVVRFTASDGRRREVQMQEGSSSPSYERGEQVTVLYDPEHPLDARIKSVESAMLMWILPGITGVLGVAFGLAVFAVQKWLFSQA